VSRFIVQRFVFALFERERIIVSFWGFFGFFKDFFVTVGVKSDFLFMMCMNEKV